jgi:hypothetical protein
MQKKKSKLTTFQLTKISKLEEILRKLKGYNLSITKLKEAN